MMNNTQNQWVPEMFPSLGILDAKNQRFGNWVCFRLQVSGRESPSMLSPLERAILNHWIQQNR
jgi:hypothetical protein